MVITSGHFPKALLQKVNTGQLNQAEEKLQRDRRHPPMPRRLPSSVGQTSGRWCCYLVCLQDVFAQDRPPTDRLADTLGLFLSLSLFFLMRD